MTTKPSDQPVTADIDRDDSTGDTAAEANVDLGGIAGTAGDTISDAGDTVNDVTNNTGDTVNNIVGDTIGDTVNNTTTNNTSTTTGSGGGDVVEGGGGGGGVAIGGFSGTYNEDWRARCVRVLREPKKFKHRVVEYCRRLAGLKKQQQSRAQRPSAQQQSN